MRATLGDLLEGSRWPLRRMRARPTPRAGADTAEGGSGVRARPPSKLPQVDGPEGVYQSRA
jgi:hypothetical protein